MKYDSEVAHERAENARLVAELRAVKSDLAAARKELAELRRVVERTRHLICGGATEEQVLAVIDNTLSGKAAVEAEKQELIAAADEAYLLTPEGVEQVKPEAEKGGGQ